MIDIHPPQHGSITRHDFFIHLFIVVLGILIAIGLEQLAESVHNRRQRNELIHDMRSEARDNLPIFARDLRGEISEISWFRRCSILLTQATPRDGFIDVTLPSGEAMQSGTLPAHAAWPIAQANGKAALLPENLAEIYERLNSEADIEQKAADDDAEARSSFTADVIRLNIHAVPGAILHLTLHDRDTLTQAFSQMASAEFGLFLRDAIWQGASEAVVHNVQSRDAMNPYIKQSVDFTRESAVQIGLYVRPPNQPPSQPQPATQEHIP